MPQYNRKSRRCGCTPCVTKSRNLQGQLLPYTTWRSHQKRQLAISTVAKAVADLPITAKEPTSMVPQELAQPYSQELYTASTGVSSSNCEQRSKEEGLVDFGEGGSSFGVRDLAQDEDLLTGQPSLSLQEADLCNSAPAERQDSQDKKTSNTQETLKFRFDVPNSPPPTCDLFSSDEPYIFWKIILLLVSCLNLRFHLPHRACNLILTVLHVIFLRLGNFLPTDKPAATLRTAFNNIGLEDKFITLPMCPTCRRIYPANSPSNLSCDYCERPLFKSKVRLRTAFDGSNDKDEDLTNIPILKFPFQPLSTQLPAFVCRFEDVLDRFALEEREDAVMKDIRDGRVYNMMPAADGSRFFFPADLSELRLGLTLHFDGFGGERGRNGPSYSSGVLSHCVVNLPVHLKYQPGNLLLTGIIPGPKEATCDELQFVLEADVDDKIRLYEEGIIVKTPRYPNGRLVHAVCIADCCDHPALCRVCGFADHSHTTRFCTRCKIPRADLASIDGLKSGKYEVRTDAEHRAHSQAYKDAEPGNEPHEREGLFKENGARYYAMSRLPYFDAVSMSVIDPMHNILLGLCRCHWLNSWIRRKALRERTAMKPRELDQVHSYLQTFEMPSWVGRLPSQVGYPAGGSLSADEYKALVLVYCPVIIPLIWREWQPLAQADYEKAIKKWEANEIDPTTEATEKPKLRMHPDDADNFLKLATALKIILGRSIRFADIPRAQKLLEEYLEGYLSIHTLDVKPNHHWVTHLFEQILDYGPVYGFWTFTSERLNKVLKSFATNNHNGGEIETSFLRAFIKDAQLREILHSLASSPCGEDDSLRESAVLMLGADADIRGTVASVASMVEEVENLTKDCSLGFKRPCLGPAITKTLSDSAQVALLNYYTDAHPEANVCSRASRRTSTSNYLVASAKFHSYLIIDGRRMLPSTSPVNAPNSIIQVEFDGHIYVGQIIAVFSHQQFQINQPTTLVQVQWFIHLEDAPTSLWDPYPELEVFFWKYNDYSRPGEAGPPPLIASDLIKSQAARATIDLRAIRLSDEEEEVEPKLVWVTIGLSRDNIVI